MKISLDQLSVFAEGAEAHCFNIPNYPVFDTQGNLYVSESGAFRKKTGKILKFGADGKRQVWHPGPFNFRNSIALSLDEKYLYHVNQINFGVKGAPLACHKTYQ